MSKPLTDAEALAHYRDELNRTRKAIKDMAQQLEAGDCFEAVKSHVLDDLYRILGERP